MHGEGTLYRSYLRSNGVQLPTLLINPPPHPARPPGPSSLASILNPIVVRLSARDTCEGYPLQRTTSSITVPGLPNLGRFIRAENHSASLSSILRPAALRCDASRRMVRQFAPICANFLFFAVPAEIAQRREAAQGNFPGRTSRNIHPQSVSLITSPIFIAANQAAISGKRVAQSISTTCIPLPLIARLILKVRALATRWLQLDRTQTAARDQHGAYAIPRGCN